ncbi:MAG TPA: prohibitin family protein [Candidatus Limnocylindrales bacterium]|nr:prohibitin family protein [Candidatus Limnocylindrales bacterium]
MAFDPNKPFPPPGLLGPATNPPILRYLPALGLAALLLAFVAYSATYQVPPGHRGVEVRLGRVSPDFRGEGFGFKTPFLTQIYAMSIRQQTRDLVAECYSSDLQQVNAMVKVLVRIPEQSVVRIFQEYSGEPFETLVAPRVQEALKEVTALSSAESIVKNREGIKQKALSSARSKVGDLLEIQDLVIQNLELTDELEAAIEAKMVQEQEAAKAKYTQQKAEIEAQTVIIRAKAEAESIRIRGSALTENPSLIGLQIVEKWDGTAPLVVGGGATEGAAAGAANILLPLGALQRTPQE